ncbi:TnsA-like heteromeric transposase endonuclease subunit [Leifsonia naganoensis]|uniref:TnsA-like heteromeric transposase endonuclease subunit n=1 Tax=Leifsonia naganoensis TaxID=150025 RepID=A0A853DSM1_9MICO|nr:TnsA-like heteromeric transposase endonuclease subunit [Leifsonia naganoensis]NYK09070.1 hypothetical protein [Leifsonia naganoensis]
MTGRTSTKYKALKPSRAGSDLLIWEDSRGKVHRDRIGPERIHDPLHLANPARIPVPYQAMPNRHGKYWFSQTGNHVWHESMFERWALMMLDFGADVIAVSSQPCLLEFTDGSYHYPDFFVIFGDGSRGLIDVHSETITDEETLLGFQSTQSACRRIGWSYELLRHVNPVVIRNLELLMMYRHPINSIHDDQRKTLLEAVDGLPFGEAVHVDPSVPSTLTTCRIYQLLWTGELIADLTRPFGDYTILRSN